MVAVAKTVYKRKWHGDFCYCNKLIPMKKGCTDLKVISVIAICITDLIEPNLLNNRSSPLTHAVKQ